MRLPRFESESGAATVEYAGLVLLVAALIAALIAAIASSPPTPAARELGSTLARRLRCAPALPGPCWRDPLTLAYGRPLAGAVRALAPAPHTAAAADGSPLLPGDFRYCPRESRAGPGHRHRATAADR